MIEKLFDELAALPEVEAIVLGGSRSGEVYDEKSDYDIYLYCTGAVDEQARRNAYTTCMWHNLKTCKIIYDRDGRLADVKKRFDVPYPKQLKENIIDNNMKILYQSMPAYKFQIEKAVERRDLVNVNHRTAAFIESYFDIIFALNELTHPGEKRLIELCKEQCKILPENFEANLNQLFSDMFINFDAVDGDVENIIVELEKVL